MKIRKILPLLSVALVALFVLAGCDQILETLFPNDTGHGSTNSGNNTLTVQAYLWTDFDQAYSPFLGQIHIDLMDQTGTTVIQTSSQWADNWDQYYYDDTTYFTFSSYYRYPASASFNFIDDGTYTIRVWYDANYNDQFDSSEHVISNQTTGFSPYNFYTSSNGLDTIGLSGGQNTSVKAYIDPYGFEAYGSFGYN